MIYSLAKGFLQKCLSILFHQKNIITTKLSHYTVYTFELLCHKYVQAIMVRISVQTGLD